MSIIEKLTEGIVNRNMEAEGAALLDKWTNRALTALKSKTWQFFSRTKQSHC